MTLVELAARKLSIKKRNAKLAAAFPNGVRCQKCLELGHWSYECKEKRKYVDTAPHGPNS
ncbi:hypothetical protein DOY81_013891 [Sarcophaga bullata]|nr:hypothetical protein DOY81_013891 [Sarcophaga bullata]